jgi:2-hydroxy-3-keto-5-methylthiopentenyl-1-phosphate phosphatase
MVQLLYAKALVISSGCKFYINPYLQVIAEADYI